MSINSPKNIMGAIRGSEVLKMADPDDILIIQHFEGAETIRASQVDHIVIVPRYGRDNSDNTRVHLTDGRCLDISDGGWIEIEIIKPNLILWGA